MIAIKEYLTIGLGIAAGIFALAAWGLWHALGNAQEALATVRGEYSAFRTGVERIGRDQEARNKETAAKQEKISHERYKSLQDRYSALDARYRGLRDSAGSGAGSSPMPAVPDTARPVDDSARDTRLLEVLRSSDRQTAQLIELQNWIRSQP